MSKRVESKVIVEESRPLRVRTDAAGRLLLPVYVRRMFGIRPFQSFNLTLTDSGMYLQKHEQK